MPKCPKCKAEINHLHNHSTWWHRYDMGVTIKGEADYVETKTWEAGENSFDCPECDEVLFHSEADAIKFLMNKKGK